MNIKQLSAAKEATRSSEIKELKHTLKHVQQSVSDLQTCMENDIKHVQLCIDRIESEKVNDTTSHKTEIKQLKQSIKSMEESVDLITVSPMSNTAKKKKVKKSLHPPSLKCKD